LDADPSSSAGVGRCWGRSTGSSGRGAGVVWRNRGRSGTHGLSAEDIEGVGSVRGSVDCEHHSAGTVVSLSTVNPNRLGVVHRDDESGELGSVITNRFARGEEKSDRNVPIPEEGNSQSGIKPADHGVARVVEGGLSSGMVFLMELEGNGVSWLSNNSAGIE